MKIFYLLISTCIFASQPSIALTEQEYLQRKIADDYVTHMRSLSSELLAQPGNPSTKELNSTIAGALSDDATFIQYVENERRTAESGYQKMQELWQGLLVNNTALSAENKRLKSENEVLRVLYEHCLKERDALKRKLNPSRKSSTLPVSSQSPKASSAQTEP